MATMSFQVEIGYGESDSVLVTGSAQDAPPGVSGLYVKLFAPTDTQGGQPLLAHVPPNVVPVTVERRYELPAGAGLRIEVDLTAGSSGAPVAFTARTPDGRSAEGVGLTNETIAVELVAP